MGGGGGGGGGKNFPCTTCQHDFFLRCKLQVVVFQRRDLLTQCERRAVLLQKMQFIRVCIGTQRFCFKRSRI